MTQSAEDFEKAKAAELLSELDTATGSRTPTARELQDWNIRAETLCVFSAIRQLTTEHTKRAPL